MSELIETQTSTYNSIVKLGINIKKDSAERKTSDEYFKKRIANLEILWHQYQFNHDRISGEVSKGHPYFTEQTFEKARKAYEQVKALIREQHTQLVQSKAGSSTSTGEIPTAPSRTTPGDTDEKRYEDAGANVQKQKSSSKLNELLRRQYANFKIFMRTVANINVELITDRWEFEDSLKTLQARWSTIDNLHLDIEIEVDGGENETYINMYERYEKQFYELKRALNKKMGSVSHREKTTPKIEIPTFTGNYSQWVSFKDLFLEVIHNNPILSNAQKMQHLKSKISGDAERLIQHLQISSDNYSVCWDILTHRCDNKKIIFSSYMNTMLGLPNMQQQSAQQIKRIHDTTLECLNAIKNLGVDITSWDPMIVHILGQKLDTETYTDYIASLKNAKDLPILQEFLEFLEMTFTTLETARRKHEAGTSKPTSQTSFSHQHSNNLFNKQNNNYNYNKHSYGNKSVAKSLQVSNIMCPLCNNQHAIYNCKNYLLQNSEQKVKTANRLKLCTNCLFSHNGQTCTSTQTCRKCSAPHNTLLHDAFAKSANSPKPWSNEQKTAKHLDLHNETIAGNSNASQEDTSQILLSTAIVKVKDVDGCYHNMRALIDQGSQISLITEKAAQLLRINRQRCKGVVFGIGQKESNSKGIIRIEIGSLNNDFTFETDTLIMNNLIKSLPNKTFPRPSWSHINNITLADPEFYNSRPVDLLLGADVYAIIMQSGLLKGESSQQPMAQQSQLGWLLCGSVKTYQCNLVINNLEDIHKFWEVDEIYEPTDMTKEEQECMEFYAKTTRRLEDGRYEVRIPLKEELKHRLGTSKAIAIAQLTNMERRFQRQEALAKRYRAFMKEYEDLKHMRPAESNYNRLECYLPHHSVVREASESTKLRVVFNASAPTSSKWSLNDIMHKGPNLQKNLQSLLIQWRQFPYAYTADIEKMYRAILTNIEDQQLQKIVWRESPEQSIQSYQLTTVTYGTKAAPFLAIMTLKRLAADERTRYPEAAAVLEGSYYVDDLLHGSYTVEQGKQMISDLINLLRSGGFNLRKWSSNNKELLEKTQECTEDTVFTFKTEDTSKTLGLCWNSKEDQFTFNCNFSKLTTKLTKRRLLSKISKLFDLLGWLTPLSTKLKLLFQKLWKDELQWDDEVSDNIRNEWSNILIDIDNINKCNIPRWLYCKQGDVIELHGFCDASINAYACVVYARSKTQQKTVIVAAKSKLVPHKKALTLPQTELCGAQLLAKLIEKIKQSLNNLTEVYGWCDSMVVLGWLHGESTRWKPFVANRVNTIKQIMPAETWRYVKSEENAADPASRGLTATQLLNNHLWWRGPSWLPNFETMKQNTTYKTDEDAKNIKNVHTVQADNNNIIEELLQSHNSFTKVTRVVAWIRRAVTPVAKRQLMPNYLTVPELRNARLTIIKYVQQTEFASEIARLNKGTELKTNSKLLNLNPFVDREGILRVGGRLRKANISEEMKHPKIIPNKSRLTELLIDKAHQLTFHGGPRLTLSTLRQRYWITSGYSTTKQLLRNCITCRKHETRKNYQLMGDLPAARINQAAPFFHTGVDYTGFVETKINKGRGVRTTKGYVAVFVCMVTKAVHLELVSDLTSSAFLAALKRMAARKGTPRHLYSDQGTNFVGANRLLQEEYEQLQAIQNSVLSDVAQMNIEWHFNAPSWPSAGGLWERAVQSLKYHLRRVVGEQKLTYEEFSTVLAELEACLNSRPLCSLTEDIEDLDYLSPAHFLTGRSGLTVIETREDARTRWHMMNAMFQQIWKKWKEEYLSQLTAREKWIKPQRNIQVGDLVMIHEDNIPAGKWALGRVLELFPGSDGLVRVVSVKTKHGIMKRPVVKLSTLPVKPAEQQQT